MMVKHFSISWRQAMTLHVLDLQQLSSCRNFYSIRLSPPPKMTATFPHQSKDQQSAMEEIVDIVRQIGRQQGANVYFRTCYALFKHLQDKAEQASEDLLHLHQSGAFGFSDDEFYLVYQVAQELQISVHDLADQALKAQLACEEFCELDPSYSAREAFKFTDTVQTAGKSEADASQGVCDSPRSMQFIMLPVNDL